MTTELVMVNLFEKVEGNLFRLSLNRGFNGTLPTAHEAGPWLIVTAPVSGNDMLGKSPEEGLSLSDIALTFPALKPDDTWCLVSAKVANWLDLGYLLMPVKVVE